MSLGSNGSSQEENDDHIQLSEAYGTVPAPDEEIQVEQEQLPPAPAPAPETQLPPEAQGEANGGPLGCCLGVMVGLVLSLSVAVLSRFYADSLAHAFGGWLSTLVRIVMALVAVAGVLICGRFGWKIGKRIYKEYEIDPARMERLQRAYRKRK